MTNRPLNGVGKALFLELLPSIAAGSRTLWDCVQKYPNLSHPEGLSRYYRANPRGWVVPASKGLTHFRWVHTGPMLPTVPVSQSISHFEAPELCSSLCWVTQQMLSLFWGLLRTSTHHRTHDPNQTRSGPRTNSATRNAGRSRHHRRAEGDAQLAQQAPGGSAWARGYRAGGGGQVDGTPSSALEECLRPKES